MKPDERLREEQTSWVARTAVALIALQLAIRAVLAFGGYFYWDDLILVGRAGTQTLLSPAYLFDDHDGHVMPGAFLVAGAITRLAPLNWIGPAISLVVLQLLASLALLRALHVILGWRPVLLMPLTFALFTPLAVPGFAWWAAALNSLPMLAAMAWVCADAILLVRTGNQRYARRPGSLVFLGGLLFFEKSAVIPFVAFAVAALLGLRDRRCRVGASGVARGCPAVGRRALALTAGWVGVYLVVVDQQRWSLDLAMTWDLLARSVTHGIVPGLVGGPWDWQRWAPASPWATPPVTVMVLGWVALAAVVAVTLLRKQRIGPVWLAARGLRGGLPGADLPDAVVAVHRAGTGADAALSARSRRGAGAAGRGRLVRAEPGAVALAGRVARAHRRDRSPDGGVRGQQPVLDRDVPDELARQPGTALSAERAGAVWPRPPARPMRRCSTRRSTRWCCSGWRGPENLASHMFALVRDRPEFDSATTELRMLDNAGSGGRREGDVGAQHRAGTGAAAADTWCSRTSRSGCRWTARCCRRTGRPRSTTWPTATAR